MIEGRQRAQNTTHDGHWVGITTEAAEEDRQLFIHHGVVCDSVVELFLLGGAWQLTLKQ